MPGPLVLLGVLLGLGVAAGVFALTRPSDTSEDAVQLAPPPTLAPSAVPTPEPTPDPTPIPTANCTAALHPDQGSDERRLVLDGLRRHYRYEGRYTVQHVTMLGEWTYIEAARFDEADARPIEPFEAYLLRYDGRLWNLQWSGRTGQSPDDPGDPRYPPAFVEPARDVMRC